MRFENHAHTMYSNIRIVDSTNRPKELILKAAELGYCGIAITDHEALCGHIEWLMAEKELKEKGKIPKDFVCALGNEIYLVDERETSTTFPHFILIAKNTDGHRALRELSSNAWYNSFTRKNIERVPTTKAELAAMVKRYPGSLIASSACLGSELAQLTMNLVKEEKQGHDGLEYKEKIRDFLLYCLELFGKDFYIEIAPSKSKDQILYNDRVVKIADAFGIKVIIGTDAHFYTNKERPWHKAFLNSKDGEREVDDFYAYAHLMDDEEAKSNLSDFLQSRFEEFCSNSIEIAREIGTYELFHSPIIPHTKVKFYEKGRYSLPQYGFLNELINSDNDQERYWVNQCLETLRTKCLWNDVYLSRLNEEADILNVVSDKLRNCMYEYFNTFQHYIDLFWECGTVVGPGRGSASCFLSNYLLGITQVDAIKWNLPAFRFLNKERVELPDIDVDLAASKRPLIFQKIREEQGELNLIQVATFGTETARSACRTACKGYRSDDYPNGIDVDTAAYLTSLIPSQRGVTWSISDVMNGNEEKERAAKKEFVNEMNKYPGLLEIILAIEGLVSKRSQHASGVMIYNGSPFETNAIMKSPNGDLITQFELHTCEMLGDTKFDFLVTQICDKQVKCIELLQEGGHFDKRLTLREIYDDYLHPEKIDLHIKEVWDAIDENEIIDLFQFDSMIGAQGIAQVKPRSISEMVMTNALIRLTGEKGEERPIDRYVRLKNNLNAWYMEMRAYGLTEEEIKVLEPHYKQYYGVPVAQESLMQVCMDSNIAGFSLQDANFTRKVVAKKHMDKIPALKEKFISSCKSRKMGEYVWKTCMEPQMSYSFGLGHATPYSLIGYQTAVLATLYPRVYWNCACLIVNSGSNEAFGIDNDDEDDEELDGKKKNKTTDYGRIASAIGRMKDEGIEIAPPDINNSTFTFTPNEKRGTILYGISGITKVGRDVVLEIIRNRPYTSIEDFTSKVHANKTQVVNLIKSGAFDEFGDRRELMLSYLDSIADKKKALNLRNLQTLIEGGYLPEKFEPQIKCFRYNKYLKGLKNGNFYSLDRVAFNAFDRYAPVDLLRADDESTSGFKVACADWDKIWKKQQDVLRPWVKEHEKDLLEKVNQRAIDELMEKYAEGTISKWEMDSVSYYSHPHELANVDHRTYGFADFSKLSDEPEIESVVKIKGKEVPLYRIHRIVGTVLDRDKMKHTVTILTTTGVVTVSVFGDVFAHYDRQISARNADGTKSVLEKSWFSRGSKIIVSGIKRDGNFLLKKYRSTPWHSIELITSIDENGAIETRGERMEAC